MEHDGGVRPTLGADSAPGGNCDDRGGVRADANCLRRELLALQCHSEGVMWRGLLPLLATPERCQDESSHCRRRRNKDHATARKRALSILVDHFRDCIHRGEPIGTITSGSHCAGEEDASKMDTGDKSSHDKTSHYSGGASSHWFIYDDQCNSRRHSNSKRKAATVVIILLPPDSVVHERPHGYDNPHCYSRTPSARPANPFALRLIRYENSFVRLTSLSAFISTLGGGFFLCRYLSTAVALARKQCAIALMRGDSEMALKCRINEGYCYIHAGKLNRGKRAIRRVLKDVMEIRAQRERAGLLDGSEDGLLHHAPGRELSELAVIKNMCESALRFADLIKEASESAGETTHDSDEQQEHKTGANGSGRVSPTHDNFQRIRIVQDRKWK